MLLKKCTGHSENKLERILNCVSFATLFVALGMLLLVLYWSLYPYNPLTINKSPLAVSKSVVKAGDGLVYTLDYCKNDDLPVTITNEFVDGIVFTTQDLSASNKKGCNIINVLIEVPKSLPSGKVLHIRRLRVSCQSYKNNCCEH